MMATNSRPRSGPADSSSRARRSRGVLRAGRLQHQLVLGQLRRRARLAEPAAAHHGDAIAQAEQLGQVAADERARARGRRSRASETSASMSA